jgi:hypothetical protein
MVDALLDLAKQSGKPMSIDTVRNVLLWCTIINYGLLLLGVVIIALPHEWMYRLSSRLFRLSSEQFDAFAYGSIVLYKTGILLFNLVPYLALRIVG